MICSLPETSGGLEYGPLEGHFPEVLLKKDGVHWSPSIIRIIISKQANVGSSERWIQYLRERGFFYPDFFGGVLVLGQRYVKGGGIP